MHDVFVSYARKDYSRVRPVIQLLEAYQLDVWWDEAIPPTVKFDDYIKKKLSESRTALVVWSSNSAESNYVLGEAREARAEGKLVSISIDDIEDVTEKLTFDLRSFQTLDFSNWNGLTEWPKAIELIKAIANLAGKGVGKPTQKQVRVSLPSMGQIGFVLGSIAGCTFVRNSLEAAFGGQDHVGPDWMGELYSRFTRLVHPDSLTPGNEYIDPVDSPLGLILLTTIVWLPLLAIVSLLIHLSWRNYDVLRAAGRSGLLGILTWAFLDFAGRSLSAGITP